MIRFSRIQFLTRISLSSANPFQRIVTQVIAKRAVVKTSPPEKIRWSRFRTFRSWPRLWTFESRWNECSFDSETGSGRPNRMKQINHEDAIVRNDRQIRTKPYAWRETKKVQCTRLGVRDEQTKMEGFILARRKEKKKSNRFALRPAKRIISDRMARTPRDILDTICLKDVLKVEAVVRSDITCTRICSAVFFFFHAEYLHAARSAPPLRFLHFIFWYVKGDRVWEN